MRAASTRWLPRRPPRLQKARFSAVARLATTIALAARPGCQHPPDREAPQTLVGSQSIASRTIRSRPRRRWRCGVRRPGAVAIREPENTIPARRPGRVSRTAQLPQGAQLLRGPPAQPTTEGDLVSVFNRRDYHSDEVGGRARFPGTLDPPKNLYPAGVSANARS
jgi:hypothetical protein